MKIRVLDIAYETMADGPGLRTSIYCAGCAHHCLGCHNPHSWDFAGGQEMSVQELSHAMTLHEYAVQDIEQLKTVYPEIPVEMQDKWDHAHKEYVEKAAWIKQMQAM